MSKLREVAEEALRWMEHARLHLTIKERLHPDGLGLYDSATEALRAALAQPKTELRDQHKAFTHWYFGLRGINEANFNPEYLAWAAWKAALAQPEAEAGVSWDGHNVRGDADSIAEVRRLIEFEDARQGAKPASEPQEVTVLPDGSAFGMMSFPLPYDHWMYRDREYLPGADEPVDLPKPILTHALREHVEAAVRYAVRGATNCGKELDFDPDALVLNAVYALCGPYGGASLRDIEPPTEAQT